MKYSIQFGLLFLILSSCHNNRQFTSEESKFFKPYKPGDTLFFLSSLNERDTFSIISIDSAIGTKLGFFANEVQNNKYIFIRKLPIDTSHGMSEDFIKKNRLDYHEFLSAHKHPEEKTLTYCVRFKEFEACTQNSFGQLVDTITIMGKKIKDCYTFKNINLQSDSSDMIISNIYWTVESGLIAYKLVNGTEWIRTSFR